MDGSDVIRVCVAALVLAAGVLGALLVLYCTGTDADAGDWVAPAVASALFVLGTVGCVLVAGGR